MIGSIARRVSRAINPVLTERHIGTADDALDNIGFLGGFEDPDRFEDTMAAIYADARSDKLLADTLRKACLQEDVAASFDFYLTSRVPAAIIELLKLFGIGRESALVDVGCGRGHAAYALHRNGFTNITAMDPNSRYSTGTAYLAALPHQPIRIINSIAEWRGIKSQFDAAVSTSTVHHWSHIPHGAIDLRRTLKPGGYWFMITEYFANNPAEFVSLLNDHPLAKRYGTYEWPYPASAYVDLIESVGLGLAAVIPLHYADNRFYQVALPAPQRFDAAKFTRKVDKLLRKPGATVNEFWDEVDAFRSPRPPEGDPAYNLYAKRFYTNPQVLVFQRVAA
jgi:2-polyprenyl-3-methyl-5-hydroxy-6-metoxy-1,4-benzoquinol methylase